MGSSPRRPRTRVGTAFKTVVGEVKFGKGGGWSKAFVLQVQYQNIKGADLSDFRDARTQAVFWPSIFASGKLIYHCGKPKRKVQGGRPPPPCHFMNPYGGKCSYRCP